MTSDANATCMCANTGTLDALRCDPSSTVLEEVLEQERRLRRQWQAVQSCQQCSSNLDSLINLLKQIKLRSGVSADTHGAHIHGLSDSTFLRDQPISQDPHGWSDATNKRPSVRVGMLELDESDSDLVARSIMKHGLLEIQGIVNNIQNCAHRLCKNGRGSEIRYACAQLADVDRVAEDILSKIWKAIARQTMGQHV